MVVFKRNIKHKKNHTSESLLFEYVFCTLEYFEKYYSKCCVNKLYATVDRNHIATHSACRKSRREDVYDRGVCAHRLHIMYRRDAAAVYQLITHVDVSQQTRLGGSLILSHTHRAERCFFHSVVVNWNRYIFCAIKTPHARFRLRCDDTYRAHHALFVV